MDSITIDLKEIGINTKNWIRDYWRALWRVECTGDYTLEQLPELFKPAQNKPVFPMRRGLESAGYNWQVFGVVVAGKPVQSR